jgi:hypothetical protein
MAAQLAGLPAPALVVLDGQTELTTLTQQLWPRAPIQRCWWHVPPGLRKAFYADEALATWDAFTQAIPARQAHQRAPTWPPPATTPSPASTPPSAPASLVWADPSWAPESSDASCANSTPAPTSAPVRWSIAGLRDLLTVHTARLLHHPACKEITRATHRPSTIPFRLRKLNA